MAKADKHYKSPENKIKCKLINFVFVAIKKVNNLEVPLISAILQSDLHDRRSSFFKNKNTFGAGDTTLVSWAKLVK